MAKKDNKKTDLKTMDIKSLRAQAKTLKMELAENILSKNMNQMKDKKTIFRNKKLLAQTLTILRQKELIEMLSKVENAEVEKTEEKGASK